jgi:hypothetical protein
MRIILSNAAYVKAIKQTGLFQSFMLKVALKSSLVIAAVDVQAALVALVPLVVAIKLLTSTHT